MNSPAQNLVLIGYTQKPFGLLGELKVRPASFDMDRHSDLHTVYFKKRDQDEAEALELRGSRSDGEFWFLKFKDMRTPEEAARLSGGLLFIPVEERRELPDNMVYVSDLPGMKVVDEQGAQVGTVIDVREGAQDLIAVRTPRKEILIPWNDHFVRRVDKTTREVRVDLSALRDVL
jgi:16S rRNA processing protein RimM